MVSPSQYMFSPTLYNTRYTVMPIPFYHFMRLTFRFVGPKSVTVCAKETVKSMVCLPQNISM